EASHDGPEPDSGRKCFDKIRRTMSLSISAPEANGDLIRIRGQPQLGLGRLIKKRTSLPFEGAGGISTWKLDLPKKFPSFERFQHLRRTSSHPSCSWPGIAAETVEQAVADLFREVSNGANLGLLFSLPHDFPMEWSAFVNGASPFSVAINRDFFLYFTHGRDITLT